MAGLTKEHLSWKSERKIGREYLLLSGKYSWIPDYGYTMDRHMEEHLETHDVINFQINEGYGVMSNYKVLLKIK